MSENIGNVVPTKVPTYTEAADIRKAFNLYHYGSEDVPGTVPDISFPTPPTAIGGIAGYILALQDQINDIESGISNVTQLSPTQTLNSITTPGLYFATSSPTTALGYPFEVAGIHDLGYLSVVKSGNYVFQLFQTIGDTSRSSNTSDLTLVPKMFFRSGVLSSGVVDWGIGNSWVETSNANHTHNNLYFTKDEINARVDSAGNLSASRAAIVDEDGKLTASPIITTLELNQLDDVDLNSTVQQQLDDKAALVHYHDERYYLRSDVTDAQAGSKKTVRIFVSPSEPTGANVNDLWFY